MATNEAILRRVEEFGGGYVWEDEIFAVTLLDVTVADSEASELCRLRGVREIMLDASKLSFSVLTALAQISGLKSLVLASPSLTSDQLTTLERAGPRIRVVSQ